MFKKFFSILFSLGIITVSGFYLYNSQPCVQPITYKLGTFDSKFGLSRADFLNAVKQANEIWSKDMGKELFKYDPNGKLAVNLIYDQRQELADKNAKISSDIESTSKSADEIRAQFLSLELEYKQNLAEYNSMLMVRKNYDAVETKRLQVNALAEEINALIKKYNYLVSTVNLNINTVNQSAGKEFEEGEYIYDQSGKRINIYEFKTRAELVRVLAHEFGHAVGLEHNDNPKSIMYYLNQSQNDIPTTEDTNALKTICQSKFGY